MSATSTSLSGGSSSQSSPDVGFTEALLIGGSLLGTLMVVALCRYVMYLIFDLCINLDGGRRRRLVAEFLRKVFPFWNVRTHTAPPSPTTVELQQQRTDGTVQRLMSRDDLIRRMSSVILSQEDVDQWKKHNDMRCICKMDASNSVTSDKSARDHGGIEDIQDEASEIVFPCSICINEMKAGEKVFKSTNCHHLFHMECFLEWAVSCQSKNATEGIRFFEIRCPNCRTPLRCLECDENSSNV